MTLSDREQHWEERVAREINTAPTDVERVITIFTRGVDEASAAPIPALLNSRLICSVPNFLLMTLQMH